MVKKYFPILLAVLMFIAPNLAHADITSNLVGWWKMDEANSGACTGTIADSSSGGNTGTCVLSPTYVAGKIGLGALSFDGASNYVLGSTGPTTQTTNYTLSAWVYISGISLHGGVLHNGTTEYDGYSIGVGSGDMDSDGNDFIGLLDGIAWMDFNVSIGTGWHMITMTRDTTTSRGYVDGVVSGTTFSNTPTAPAGTAFYIGSDLSTNRYFPGAIDDVRIYTRALSQSDITQLYAYTGLTKVYNFLMSMNY